MHVFTVEDLTISEVEQAHGMLQRDGGVKPEEIIRVLKKDEKAVLLNPEQFSLDIQRRLQEVMKQQRRGEVAGR